MRFGRCEVNVPRQNILKLLIDQILAPFTLFQIFAFGVFWWQNYLVYMWIIFGIQAFTILLSLYQTVSNTEKIRRMAKFTCPVELRTDSGFVSVGSEVLLPGDVIKVPEDVLFPCDFILLSGSVIVNEAILTGESIPVMKSSLLNTDQITYSQDACSKHTLFGGTLSL
jgi:cation-transporting P-type ATPase 13A2